jgi:hypothetical protein
MANLEEISDCADLFRSRVIDVGGSGLVSRCAVES